MNNGTVRLITLLLAVVFAAWLGLQDFQLWQSGIILLGVLNALMYGSSR